MVTKSVDALSPDEIANLSDSEFNALVAQAEGNTDESEEDVKVDESLAASSAATEGKNADKEAVVGILAKDGKSIIPIEVLQQEREKALKAQALADDLTKKQESAEAELAELRAKVSEHSNLMVDPDSELTEEELSALEEDLPELAAKIRASQGVVGRAKAMISKIEAESVQSSVQDAIDSVPKLAYLQSSNPDLFGFAVQIDDQMKHDPEMRQLTTSQRFEKVIERLEKTIGSEIKVPSAQSNKGIEIKDKTSISSLDDLPGGTPPINDEIMSIANKSPNALAAHFENMSDSEVDSFLAKATKGL
jgi:hypothetical protein